MKNNYIIYKDDELIVLNLPGGQFDQARLAIGFRATYEAHEIWLYDKINKTFNKFKSLNGDGRLLKSFLSNVGITLRVAAASLNTADPTIFRFDKDNDLFLFKLKFGV